jgi:hypothetical protein
MEAQNFFSQKKSFRSFDLNVSTCGVCCLAMAIDSLVGLDGYKTPSRNLDPFLQLLLSIHKDNGKVIYKDIVLNGVIQKVTVSPENRLKRQLEPEEYMEEVSGEFFPVFTLNNGYDHRATEFILKKFGLNGGYKEDISLVEIKEHITHEDWHYFIASIKSLRTRETHLVLIQNFGTDAQGDYVEYIDPWEDDFIWATKKTEYSFFEYLFNRRGSFVV